MDTSEFVLSQLPPPPARVLEIGSGKGELALVLADRGYEVTAIDPEAPVGPIFRQVRLEDFGEPGPFDAVVAVISLHHVHDLATALDRISELLRPRGVLVLSEFARERMAGPTLRWYHRQLQAVDDAVSEDFERWAEEWKEEHAHLHDSVTMRRELGRRFVERFFAWTPYLFSYRLHEATEPLERALIEAGAIEATGFRYVGEYAPR